MKTPGFWAANSLAARALSPLGGVTAALTARRLRGPAFDPGIPVICVGNAGVGGAGKTTVVLDLLTRLRRPP
jgi:tetraacyldisaccharide 4'-kinase